LDKLIKINIIATFPTVYTFCGYLTFPKSSNSLFHKLAQLPLPFLNAVGHGSTRGYHWAVEMAVDNMRITRQGRREVRCFVKGCGKCRDLPRVFSQLLIASKYKKNKSLS